MRCLVTGLLMHSGTDFGAAIPIVKGLWASNISRAIPAMSDTALERLLREGIHPDREIYVMPSKQTQFLSARDMAALIVGEPAGNIQDALLI